MQEYPSRLKDEIEELKLHHRKTLEEFGDRPVESSTMSFVRM